MKEEILKRLKSFIWRFGGMGLVALLTWSGQNLDLLNLSPEVVVLIGYIFNELTKFINTKFALEENIGKAVRRLSGR